MKILVASFQCESNTRALLHPGKSDFEYFAGEDIYKKLVVKDIFTENGFAVIPSIYANALPSATVEQEVYDFYKTQILDTVRANPDAAGIYLYVHGSMEVEGIGSGELQLVKEIRQIVSRDCLIALTMDLHANITEELGQYVDIVCGYKTAPHTDQEESQRRAAGALAYCLKNRIKPYTFVQKIPMLVKGDTMLTQYEPLRSLEAETVQLEQQADIFGANLFFGHCWIDAPNTSASAVVSAASPAAAKQWAQTLANKLWSTRKEYQFRIEAEQPEECVRRALAGKEKRIFITDSGDNTTAGAEGTTQELLKLFLQADPEKKTCVAGITAYETVNSLWEQPDGAAVTVPGLERKGVIKTHGEILGWAKEIIGRCLTVSFGNVDAIFTEKRSGFIEKGNFDKANVDLLDYEIVVVKLGYLFEELKPYADRELFALTDGASCVELSRLNLKNIVRPMYPLEDFAWRAE
ncbi:MAG: M81 family metallopeptidase [Oscillospiraceae bacterium]|nr:M81 family metallopeptidase [Oscillospiraceae bacterium]